MLIRRFSKILLTCAAAALLFHQQGYAKSFNIGSISLSPVEETRKFWPLAEYLARQLQSEEINQGNVVVAESILRMSSFLQAGQVDLLIDSVFPSLAVSRLSGSKLMLRRWKMGKSEYHSVIFTRNDSGIARLVDLKGKIIAFEDAFGTSGYFIPKIVLSEKGFRLAQKRRGTDPVKADEVGYLFSHSDSKTLLSVATGGVAAGATDDQKYFAAARNIGTLKIVHETFSYPRQIVSYRADLPAQLMTRVKEILLNMNQTDQGRQVLQAFESTTRFEELPDHDLELLKRLRPYIDTELKLQR